MREKLVSQERDPGPALDPLIRQAQAGREEAFHGLYEAYSRKVFGLAYHMTGDYEAARDVAQDIFLKVFEKLSGYRGEASFSTWLYRIAVNTCLDFRRQRSLMERVVGRVAAHPPHSPAESAEGGLMADERRRRVRQAIAQLSPKYRAVLVLKDVQDLSYPEMADILGCSEGTVASRLNKGRKLLYEKLKRLRDKL